MSPNSLTLNAFIPTLAHSEINGAISTHELTIITCLTSFWSVKRGSTSLQSST